MNDFDKKNLGHQCYKMIIAYDGTQFEGWQVQNRTKNTIVGTLQATFKKVFAQDIAIFGASRTDAGVHALGQVARFYLRQNIPIEKMLREWNIHLPKTIFIRSLEKSEPFNPCINVKQKIYYYHIFLKQPLPFFTSYGWVCNFIDRVNLEKFNAALQLFVGEHDFRSFCKVDPEKQHKIEDGFTVKTIDSIKLEVIKKYNLIRVTICGKAFLHFQIRRMIGYALDVARKDNLEISYLQSLLDHPKAEQILLKAPASGLLLKKIIYEKGTE